MGQSLLEALETSTPDSQEVTSYRVCNTDDEEQTSGTCCVESINIPDVDEDKMDIVGKDTIEGNN